MRILSSKSGFRTVRDLILFVTGLGICIFHIVTTPAADLSPTLLIFGGGLATTPAVLRHDEKRD